MKLRAICFSVALALSGCATSDKANDDKAANGAVAPPPAATASAVTAADFTYRMLDAENTHVQRAFDDGQRTYIEFTTPAPPAGLMVFDQNGKGLRFTAVGPTVVINSVHEGLLLRTPTRSTYTRAPARERITAQAALTGGSAASYLPVELAAARARVLEMQGRLAGLASELERASRGEPGRPMGPISAELDQLETQLAGVKATLIRARFDAGSTMLALSETSRVSLVDAAKRAERVLVRGRTDAKGSPEANQRVARARADNARRMLVAGGVQPGKVRVSYGLGNYVAGNDTEEGRAQNRRVEFVLIPRAGERISVAAANAHSEAIRVALNTPRVRYE